ncbi:single-stranded-DNA-specific exonuclease RecJ [Granulicatella sp. zg-ZJ]|uniref:single-stranded-DNA-specific exonuclease RecJ n=1 Tax=Granulicatella sp. zg-ZJ TaxID=2678504 RepID=UPI0013D4A074|nr:single-stranded-DNA-specific exonuclease RecJ [Granulicatella sp. zg-ZJ]MBS4749831.1 single-stranded-DNA-specific exonuclease RecJ [Carnobacteriaceae bacterium zg-ZUI78]NEW63017.1 single-stranded-DNA-specific exonuclease RecJ [Granulicatella sp. zg-ZJ]
MAKKSVYEWVQKEQPEEQDIKAFQEETGCDRSFAILCLQRGVHSKIQLEQFQNPTLDQLHDPYLMHDMEKAVNRIKEAIEKNEKILIYGDYDADGITSTTILSEAIDMLGGNVHFYLPNRATDGYGPNVDVYKYMIDVDHVELIVTCDNGVAGHEAIDLAMKKGVDVIVTDHHELPEALPNAYAIVHPRHPKGNYPFSDLSGAGVAFKVACALLEELPMELLDIASIGTVADVVSLVDENRVIVSHGLRMLKQTQRVGLLKLLSKAGVDTEKATTDTIGFTIGPRLNAIGRLDDATPGVDLLMTFDEDEADALVDLIEQKNNERKAVVDAISNEVMASLPNPLPNLILLANEHWQAGVLGIVASQVVEKTGKPTILLQKNIETGLAKGSGRSVSSVNLYDVLSSVKEEFVAFGGHEMAAGMTVAIDKIDILQQRLQEFVPSETKRFLTYDTVLDAKTCTIELLHAIDTLAPFGTGNERPIICVKHTMLSQMKAIGTKKQHLKGQADQMDIVQFNAIQDIPYLKDNVVASLVGQLNLNEWNGLERVQFRVMDSCINGTQFFDYRGTKMTEKDMMIDNAVYLFFDKKYYDYFKEKLIDTSTAVYYEEDVPNTVENLVLFDCPPNEDIFKNVLQNIAADNVYVMAHTRKSAYLIGLPTREQFGVLYKYIHKKQEFVIRDMLDTLVKQLNIKKDVLIFMIQVFSEVKFVTIKDGVLIFNPQHEKCVLEETEVFKAYKEKMWIEQALIYTQFSQVIDGIKGYLGKGEAR